jgi:hypothetical protein
MRVRVKPRTDPQPRRTRETGHRRQPAPVERERAQARADDLADERRLRQSGGPHDHATYACTCGYVFDAAVSTSVACPHCGTGQAW